jgi:hypothetical protein
MNQPASSSSHAPHDKLRFTTAARLFLVFMGVGLTAILIVLVLALMELL